MTKAETIFAYELSLIHDKNIKQFVITCFDKLCPDYFWTCPCSTTGKFHPQVSLGVGGLVRHTKLAVWWGIELLGALGASPELKNIAPKQLQDEVVATLLMHDMIKNGKGLNAQGRPFESDVTGTHGVTLAKIIGFDAPERIFAGIACHMGIWTTDTTFRPNSIVDPTVKAFANLIHLADYAASRKVDSIYSVLEQEKQNDIDQQTTNNTKTETPKSPPCPGVRKTESSQATTAAENSQ